ncbi:DUF1127 domain-containing protein [Rhodovulum sulfidophilum]|uniref:DUF1127 domain-containing protein n=1 Tax=Rhodovulum sulfidophilum TaxID=35806 RepID=A0ABS1RUI1_RHOSU|nr:DUF1127 domain-containing protein [Rhodovulum sulfidophilum]MBL3551348.1 DUF1127 domain-containing protein [Rhodovulum sulfidophilum]MBL3564751.1 DUF1127 domain-containing protein [Rhodovulum sulfidophilum]MBL3575031.1 DUF1127 domain-containing protein [Rhodovulum sulfidophilum]MBL3596471.1 DUF1127 domain-containing protein [Rhodovulum sulfidophilum]MBL3609752.1 DUF1127 domain-containing protein [Rhodovulum sulfidophilum]
MTTLTHVAAPNAAFIARLSALAEDIRQAGRRYGIRRQTIRELSALSDRDLKDLGILRCDIGAIATEASRNA